MKLNLSDHAIERMFSRRIQPEEIKNALENGNSIYDHRSNIYRFTFKNIQVVFDSSRDLVVTVIKSRFFRYNDQQYIFGKFKKC